MSVIYYDPDDGPWSDEEVKTLLEILPKSTRTIRVHFHYHNGTFNTTIPCVKESFPNSVTNTSTTSGLTILHTRITEEFIAGITNLIHHHPSYSIDTIRLIYESGGAIDLCVRECKELRIVGEIEEIPSALACKAAVPTLKKYLHVFDVRDLGSD